MSTIQNELDELVQNADSIASATTDIANAITAKGGTVSPGDGLLDFANDIANIPSFTPTEEQLAAMNSGIDSTKVQQIATNETNISLMRDSSIVARNEIDNNIYYKDIYGYTPGYYYSAGGTKVANEVWGYTNLIPVDENAKYTVYTPTNSTLFICYYSSDKTFISGTTSSSELTTPANAAYIRISVPIVRINDFKFAKWTYSRYTKPIFKCGIGQQFTRLKDAVAEGVKYGATVIVYAGTYDLSQEFADELIGTFSTQKGIRVANGVHIIFMSGAFVTANFDGSSASISEYFSPFYADKNDNVGFTLENAHIVASNCRYCVHDDHEAKGTYINRYINCHMEMATTRQTVFYPQAIGGGLGEHGTIIIDGGYYKSNPSYGYATYGEYGTAQNIQQPISFHNASATNAYGHIFISNVYLADRGYIRIGSYGSSTSVTPVEISNCAFGLPILDMFETEQSTNHNMGITAYNNTSRNAEVPFDFSRVIDIYTNSDE